MTELLSTEEFQLPIESLKNNLDFLQSFYDESRFINMDEAKILIEKYKRAIDILEKGDNAQDGAELTEPEIRKDFEWAWQAGFAKEVE